MASIGCEKYNHKCWETIENVHSEIKTNSSHKSNVLSEKAQITSLGRSHKIQTILGSDCAQCLFLKV